MEKKILLKQKRQCLLQVSSATRQICRTGEKRTHDFWACISNPIKSRKIHLLAIKLFSIDIEPFYNLWIEKPSILLTGIVEKKL